jgi:integrase
LLLLAGYDPKTVIKYQRYVLRFLRWAEKLPKHLQPQTVEQLDDSLCKFAQHTFDRNEGSGKSIFSAAVYGISMYLPRTAGQFKVAYRYIKAWNKLVPSKSAPPFTDDVVSAIAMHFVVTGQARYGLAVLLQFDCLLRVSELMNLRARDVAFAGDHRLGSSGFKNSKHVFSDAAICFRNTKTGPLQSVLVLNPAVASLLRFALIGKKPDDFLFPSTTKDRAASFRKALTAACVALGLSPDYKTHSCRHGGATFLFLIGWAIADIKIRGRWKSDKSVEHYIQIARALLMQYSIPAAVASAGALFSKNLVASFSLAQSLHSMGGL